MRQLTDNFMYVCLLASRHAVWSEVISVSQYSSRHGSRSNKLEKKKKTGESVLFVCFVLYICGCQKKDV